MAATMYKGKERRMRRRRTGEDRMGEGGMRGREGTAREGERMLGIQTQAQAQVQV